MSKRVQKINNKNNKSNLGGPGPSKTVKILDKTTQNSPESLHIMKDSSEQSILKDIDLNKIQIDYDVEMIAKIIRGRGANSAFIMDMVKAIYVDGYNRGYKDGSEQGYEQGILDTWADSEDDEDDEELLDSSDIEDEYPELANFKDELDELDTEMARILLDCDD